MGEALDPVAIEAIRRITLQPLQGTQTITFSGLTIDISWDIGPGYYGILIAATMKIAGGFILRRAEFPIKDLKWRYEIKIEFKS